MKIETQFDVHNLVMHKFQKNPIESNEKHDFICCFEVMEIKSQTCYAGTQIFYECRTIHGIEKTEYIDGKKENKFYDFSAGANTRGEYVTYREDELKAAPQELIDLILG